MANVLRPRPMLYIIPPSFVFLLPSSNFPPATSPARRNARSQWKRKSKWPASKNPNHWPLRKSSIKHHVWGVQTLWLGLDLVILSSASNALVGVQIDDIMNFEKEHQQIGLVGSGNKWELRKSTNLSFLGLCSNWKISIFFGFRWNGGSFIELSLKWRNFQWLFKHWLNFIWISMKIVEFPGNFHRNEKFGWNFRGNGGLFNELLWNMGDLSRNLRGNGRNCIAYEWKPLKFPGF